MVAGEYNLVHVVFDNFEGSRELSQRVVIGPTPAYNGSCVVQLVPAPPPGLPGDGIVSILDASGNVFAQGPIMQPRQLMGPYCNVDLGASSLAIPGKTLEFYLKVSHNAGGTFNVYGQAWSIDQRREGQVSASLGTIVSQGLAPVSIAINTSPAPLSFTVDGQPCTSSCVFWWMPFSSHTLSTTQVQPSDQGTLYYFTGWSDGGALTHTITVPSVPNVYTAQFTPLPSISYLSSYSGLVSSAVMISGNNFGGSQGTSTVTFNGTPAPVTSWSSTSIWVTVPNGATSGNVVVTVGGSASNGMGFTVTVTPLGTSTSLHVNLGYVPFSYYDFNHSATSFSSYACPANSTVRGCFQSILNIMAAQGVSGIRIFVTFCDPSSQAFSPTCDPTQGPVTLNAAWTTNVANFFSDVQQAGTQNARIQYVTITTAKSGPLYPMAKNLTSSSNGSCSVAVNCCDDTPDPVYFNPTVPFGLRADGDPIGWTQSTNSNQGYDCGPINSQYFIGWSNIFSVINAVLAAAQGRVTVNELEFAQQEMDLVNFPAFYRYIYDTYPGHATPPQTETDVLGKLRQLMADNLFEAGRVTWSAPWMDSDNNPTTNCTNIYTDWARNTTLDEIASAIGGQWLGLAPGFYWSDGLPCGGTYPGDQTQVQGRMYSVPAYHTQPTIVDAHIYPQLAAGTPSQSQEIIQQVATLDYSDLTHLFALVPSLQSAEVIIGETFAGTIYPGNVTNNPPKLCWNAPTSAPAGNVLGFNQSDLANYSVNYSVVFRPWMNLEDASGRCFGYGAGPFSLYTYPDNRANFQNVNLNGQGPYVPSRR